MSPGPISLSSSMQLRTQPHPTAILPVSQNIPFIPATPTTLPQTPGHTAASLVPSSPPQPASGQPRLDRSNSRMPGIDGAEHESKRAAGEPTTEKGREMPSTFKDRQTRCAPSSRSRIGHVPDNMWHPKIAPESSAKRTYSSNLGRGYGSSAPHPDIRESRRKVGGSPDSLPLITRTETPIMLPLDALPLAQNQPELRSVPLSNNATAPGTQHRPRRPSVVGDSQIPNIPPGKLSIVSHP